MVNLNLEGYKKGDKMSEVIEILSKALEINSSSLDENSNMENVEQWDSLAYFRVVSALEEKFNVEFDEDEVMKLTGVKEITEVLKSKGVL